MYTCRPEILKDVCGREVSFGREVGVYFFVLFNCSINMYYAYNVTKSDKYIPTLAKQNTLVTKSRICPTACYSFYSHITNCLLPLAWLKG